MEHITGRIVQQLCARDYIQEMNKQYYQYSIQIGLELLISAVISVVIAIVIWDISTCIMFYMTFIPLRAYSGGLHLSKYLYCAVASAITFFMILWFAKSAIIPGNTGVIIGLCLLLLIRLLSPQLYGTGKRLESLDLQEIKQKLCWVLIVVGGILLLLERFRMFAWITLIDYILILQTLNLILCKMVYQIKKKDIIPGGGIT